MRIVCLASGGVDSSLMMYLLTERGHELLPLFVDYGQLSAKMEWRACRRVCGSIGLRPARMDISGFGQVVPSGITNRELDVIKDAFLPNRNLLLLTFGASYGFTQSAYIVAIGLLKTHIFPDQTSKFIKAAEKAISSSLKADIRIMTPLISLDKLDVLKISHKHQLPFQATYSCHSGDALPCGKCISCKELESAMKEL